MNNFKMFIKGMASVVSPKNEFTNVLERYPATFSRNDNEAIRNDWIKVGNDIKKGIEQYEKTKK
ncbi:hypothetical protein [Streptobacillus ratti]|uniref:hypothetical protein n=1 Tax=Streptobacillus ratti TaxID=1720557 RepID=UPI000932EB9C|nr:hypothetical protein [Streptobacillus ratti]